MRQINDPIQPRAEQILLPGLLSLPRPHRIPDLGRRLVVGSASRGRICVIRPCLRSEPPATQQATESEGTTINDGFRSLPIVRNDLGLVKHSKVTDQNCALNLPRIAPDHVAAKSFRSCGTTVPRLLPLKSGTLRFQLVAKRNAPYRSFKMLLNE
jgi:hypothetical protein